MTRVRRDIAAVTDDFVGRLASDRQLGKFFVGHSTNSLNRIRQLVVDERERTEVLALLASLNCDIVEKA